MIGGFFSALNFFIFKNSGEGLEKLLKPLKAHISF